MGTHRKRGHGDMLKSVIKDKLSSLPSLTCVGRSLPLQISSHGNTNSPTASTETTTERKRQFGKRRGRETLHTAEYTSPHGTID